MFQLVFSLPGIIGAGVAFSGMVGKSSATGKAEELAKLSFGPLYLSMMLVKMCISIALGSLGTHRRASGVNVPDQHVYKVVGGSASGAMVLMDEDGAFGNFNRAQRGVQNIFEQTFPFAIETVLSGYVFPWTTAACFGLFAMFRAYGAVLYAGDRMARMKGNLPAGLASGTISGLVFMSGIYATRLEFK
eukprot:symbB.v1.2.010533.t1/scaffold641.1/size177546/7